MEESNTSTKPLSSYRLNLIQVKEFQEGKDHFLVSMTQKELIEITKKGEAPSIIHIGKSEEFIRPFIRDVIEKCDFILLTGENFERNFDDIIAEGRDFIYDGSIRLCGVPPSIALDELVPKDSDVEGCNA